MSTSQVYTRVILGVCALVMFTGCATGAPTVVPSPAGPASAASSAAEPNSQPPAGGGDTACASWQGKPGVTRVFCTGPATATLTVNGKSKSLSGGECESLGTTVAFNLGVVASDMPAGTTEPDYLGIILDTSSTVATGLAYTVNGTADVVLSAKVSLGAGGKSGTLTGTSMKENAKVNVTFNCG